MQSSSIFPIIRKNVPKHQSRDLYHDLLTMGWKKTLLLFVAIFLLINALFATLFWIRPGSLLNSDGAWTDAFFFSVQSLATIGYGYWSPGSHYAHIIVTIEAAVGLILVAIITGFFFSKFSRMNSKVEFTKKIVFMIFDGKPTLVFRMINIRKNQILDSNVYMTLMKQANSIEGHQMRRFIDLKLIRSRVPVFAMSMHLMHVIDEESPLFEMHKKECLDSRVEIIVSVVGTDGTFGQPIHATHLYRVEDFIWDQRFADMVEVRPDGTRIVDYAKFNSLVPQA